MTNAKLNQSNRNRREFLRSSLATSATAGSLGVVPRASGFESPNERPRIAVVGCGSRWGWQLANGGTYGVGVSFANHADYVAVCDVDQERVAAAKGLVKQWNGSDPKTTSDYRQIIDRDDIDAVLIFTPDHWHAKIAIEAMNSGKDVYCEKPMTLTVEEGQQICKVAKETGRVMQVGTQQRSNVGMRTAIALAQSGRLGDLKRVECGIGGAPTSPAIPIAAPPSNLDWDRWLGPAPKVDFRYLAGASNETKSWSRCHYEFRWWYEYSGGKLTDWGAHHVDIATWAMGKTETGPIEIEPVVIEHPVEFRDGQPMKNDRYNTATKFEFLVKYADGLQMSIKSDARNGILLEGSEGRIFVNRGGVSGAPVQALASNPLPTDIVEEYSRGMATGLSQDASGSTVHVDNFFDSIAGRATPNSDVFSHHRALTTCHLAAIAGRLGRPLRWNPDSEQVIGDPLAQSMLAREPRSGYEIEV